MFGALLLGAALGGTRFFFSACLRVAGSAVARLVVRCRLLVRCGLIDLLAATATTTGDRTSAPFAQTTAVLRTSLKAFVTRKPPASFQGRNRNNRINTVLSRAIYNRGNSPTALIGLMGLYRDHFSPSAPPSSETSRRIRYRPDSNTHVGLVELLESP